MLKELEYNEFDKAYSILCDSFPTDERRPYEKQKELLQKSSYKLLGYVDGQSEEIKGIIAIYEFYAFIFVEHLAVSAKYRNCGLGSDILKELMGGSDLPICLEVELPETELAKRRIGFYQRNGFYFNDYPYIQPAMAEGQNPIELKIMSTGQKLEHDEFLRIKALLYKEVYGVELGK